MRILIIFIAIFMSLSSGSIFSKDTTSQRNIDSLIITTSRVLLKRTLVPNSVNIVNKSKLEASANSALLPSLGREVPGLFVTQKGVTVLEYLKALPVLLISEELGRETKFF